MIRILVVLAISYFVLAVALAALVDLSLRNEHDFELAGRGPRRVWLLAQLLSPVAALVPYFVSGRDGRWLALVPAAWLAVEVSYVVAVRPALQRARALGMPRLVKASLLYAGLVSVAAILFFPFYVTALN